MDQALRDQVRPMPESKDPDPRGDASDAVPAREGHRAADQVEGNPVGGGGAGAQADDAAPRRRPEEMTSSVWSRIGLAIVRPQAALAIAGDREHAGRSGSDLLGAIVVLIFATQLRGLLAALWLGQAVS